ncbi:MAG TPA: tRNA pseudouridine(38-40) synthase TruA, partial [Methanobacterium sp.]|nr:tRNA pseudouridine(38-40) synthase TruA [Methanobacterium sp.]
MKRVALKIAYLGSDYYGFQRQPGLKTVEGEILEALEETGMVEDVDKCGFGLAGRTDRGVHALGNVISFLTEEKVQINQINDSLPHSIRILAQAKVSLQFKARYAQQRHYRYLWPYLTEEVDF